MSPADQLTNNIFAKMSDLEGSGTGKCHLTNLINISQHRDEYAFPLHSATQMDFIIIKNITGFRFSYDQLRAKSCQSLQTTEMLSNVSKVGCNTF